MFNSVRKVSRPRKNQTNIEHFSAGVCLCGVVFLEKKEIMCVVKHADLILEGK